MERSLLLLALLYTPTGYALLSEAGQSAASNVVVAKPLSTIGQDAVTVSELDKLRVLAVQGNPDSQMELYTRLMLSGDMALNEEAMQWVHKAAAQSQAEAVNELGVHYYGGTFVAQDLERAAALFQRAALLGNQRAQLNLAYLYVDGSGVAMDQAEAIRLATPSARSGNVSAQQLLAQLLVGSGHPDQAIPWFTKAAEQGDVVSMLALHELALAGRGMTRDLGVAARWAEMAADRDSPLGLLYWGRCYVKGTGVEADVDKGLALLARAGEAGIDRAYWEMGTIYLYGFGVSKDAALAKTYFYQAAVSDSAAQFGLGHALVRGQGFVEDDLEGRKWIMRAVQGDDVEVWRRAAKVFDNADGLPQDSVLARALYTRAAEAGDAIAQNNLAVLVKNGRGGERDLPAAMAWYTKAAAQGLPIAIRNLGWHYWTGEGFEQDYSKAYRLFLQAAELGQALAQFNVALAYLDGLGVEQNDEQAFRWFSTALKNGNDDARLEVGRLYRDGRGVKQDLEKGTDMIVASANRGDRYAQVEVAWMHQQGVGLPLDESEAIAWLTRAAEGGHREAKRRLAVLYQGRSDGNADRCAAVKWYLGTVDESATDESGHEAMIGLSALLIPAPCRVADDTAFESVLEGLMRQGNYFAATDLYRLMSSRKRLEQRPELALELLRLLQNTGRSWVPFQLGLAYHRGQYGLEPDYARAVELYLQAAQQARPAALHNIALIYASGKLGIRDYVSAYTYHLLAFEFGYEKSQKRLQLIGRRLSEAQKEFARSEVDRWRTINGEPQKPTPIGQAPTVSSRL